MNLKENHSGTYRGGLFGYKWVTLILYKDSSYYYSDVNHSGQSVKDKGKWSKINNQYYLNSSSQTQRTSRKGKSDKFYLFSMQKYTIMGDTLNLIPKDPKDKDYYSECYKLYKGAN